MRAHRIRPQRGRLALAVVVAVGVLAIPAPASATHSWGGYHWARAANPFTLKLGDNVNGSWDAFLATTSADWSASTVLDTTVVGGSSNPKTCRATSGMVQVCNAKYGGNGWLGLAQIWASGTHITKGAVKLNDTYFATAAYNTPAWRNMVSCQEVGHTLGLDHQDEAFDNPNLGTCMDYTSNPSTNQHPNQHDFDQLELMYGHTDSTTTVASSTAPSRAGGHARGEWGRQVASSRDHRTAVFERDLGGGEKVITFVVWA